MNFNQLIFPGQFQASSYDVEDFSELIFIPRATASGASGNNNLPQEH